jgi:nitroimidazol reductase NimA-like FMN-containing flavoprotein (pyridoxamine 5'-phosphate oxidase superfamily)
VDEVEGPYDWRSVVVNGGLYVLEPDDDAWHHALELIRTAVPDALGEDDPTPFRTVLFRIAIQESTGREAKSARRG